MGRDGGEFFAVGRAFDGVVLDPSHPALAERPLERLVSALIYAGDASCIAGTLRRGRWVVRGQVHEHGTKFRAAFARTLKELAQ